LKTWEKPLLAAILINFDFFQDDRQQERFEFSTMDQNISPLSAKFELNFRPVWGYRCENRRCLRQELPTETATTTDLVSLGACQLTCGDEHPYTVWPRASFSFKSSYRVLPIEPNAVTFVQVNRTVETWYMDASEQRFHQQMRAKSPQGVTLSRAGTGRLTIEVDIGEASTGI
jgi:hypothetical protein